LSQINYGYFVELIVGSVVFLTTYLIVAPLIRAVNKKDVHNLRVMLSGLGPFSPIFNIPLMVLEKLSDIFYHTYVVLPFLLAFRIVRWVILNK
jgi:hypothetical protein